MSKTIFEFFVYDPPTPMGRKRWSGVGPNGGRFYTEKKDKDSVGRIRGAFLEAYPEALPIQADLPVKLAVKMWHRCPKSKGRKWRVANWMKPAVVTLPDLNNVINQVCDALSKYAYVDDRQITWITDTMAFYAIDKEGNDTRPRMFITVEEI